MKDMMPKEHMSKMKDMLKTMEGMCATMKEMVGMTEDKPVKKAQKANAMEYME